MTFSNISSISKTKGIDTFIYAVESIKNDNNLSFEIVGMASEVEKSFEIEMKEYVLTRNITNIYFKGFIDDMKEYLKGINTVVLTSVIADSLPTVLIEALAKGKVIIATDVGGVREIVDDSYGNIVIPPNDIIALKEAISKVSKYTQEELEQIKKKNIQIAKDKFTIQKQIKSITNIYEEVLI